LMRNPGVSESLDSCVRRNDRASVRWCGVWLSVPSRSLLICVRLCRTGFTRLSS